MKFPFFAFCFLTTFLIVSLFSLSSFVSAFNFDVGLNDLGTFKQGDSVSLYQTCSNCSYVTLSSLIYPNGTIVPISENMTDSGFDYSLVWNDTTSLGDYLYNVCGDKDESLACENLKFSITTTGINLSSFLENPILIVFIILSLGLLFMAVYFKNASMGFLSGIIFLLSGVYTMIYGLNNMADLYTRGIAITLIALGTIFTIAAAYEWATD